MSDQRHKLLITLRQEPRVLREWGTFDALLYNLMTMNLAVMFTVPFLTAVAFFPHGSLPGAIIIAGLFCCAEAIVYAFLASSMPRSGGDYHFQSRLVSPGVGMVFAFTGVVLGGALWMAIAGWFAANVAIGPLLSIAGRLTGWEALTRAAGFVQSNTGVFILALVVIAWSAVVNLRGMQAYAVLQRFCWVVGGLSLIVIVLLLWRLGAPALGSAALYEEALVRALAIGFDPNGGPGTLVATLALVPVAAFSLIYPAWSVQQAGEVRQAGRLRSQCVTIVIAEAATVAFSAVMVALVLTNVDTDGLAAGAYLFFVDRQAMPDPSIPFFWFFDGQLWPSGCVALCLCVLFNAWFWMWVPDITLAASRILSSMSFDRSLPRWLGDERGRRGVPANAIALFSTLCIVPATLYAYTSLWRLTLSATLLNVLAFAVTCGAAASLPYLRRELYRDSTAARFEFLGVPVITWCGGAFCVFSGFLVWRFAVDPALALGAPKWMLLAFVAFVYVIASAIHVLVGKLRRSREGHELEVTYRLIS